MDGFTSGLRNRLQEPAESLFRRSVEIRDSDSTTGHVGHQMSGSGSSYFRFLPLSRQARRLASAMRAAGDGASLPGSYGNAGIGGHIRLRRKAMEITEVRIKLTEDSDDRLQAFCSVTFDDCFVIRDSEDHRRCKRSLRCHAQPKAHRALFAMRLKEPPAGRLLQSMWRKAESRSSRSRCRGTRQTLRGHCTSHQFAHAAR